MSVSVIDSSALLALLIGGPGADEVDRALAPGGARAPAVVDVETLSTLRRWVLHGVVDERRAWAMLAACRAARIRRVPVGPLLVGAWELRDNVSAFDALYVALARVLGAPLITADSRLATAPGLGVPVTLLPA
jgi:predicted nucleic acid-binding protein